MNVFDLQAKIGLDTQGFSKGLKTAQGAMSKASKAIGSGIKTASKVGIASFAAIGTASIVAGKKILDMSKDVAEYGDNVDKMSQRVGMSAENFQKWDYVLKINGAEMSNMKMGLKTLTNQIDKANKGTKESQENFAKLGISMDEVKTLSREEMFEKVVKGFQGMEESTERAALANKMFGRSGQELAPLFNQSTKETDKLLKKAEAYGFIMSNKAVKASAKFKDSMTTLQQTMTGLKNRMAGEFLPSLTKITDGLAMVFADDNADKGMDKISKGIEGLINKVNEGMPKVMELGKTIIGSIGKSILSNLPSILKMGANVVSYFAKGVVKALPTIITAGSDMLTSFFDEIKGNSEGIASTANEIIGNLADAMGTAIPTIIDTGSTLLSDFLDSFSEGDNPSKISDAAINILTSFGNAIVTNVPKLVTAAGNMIQGFVDQLTEEDPITKETKIYTKFKEMFEGVDWGTMWKSLWDTIGSLMAGALSFGVDVITDVTEAITKWWDENIATDAHGKTWAQNLWDCIGNGFDGINDWAKKYIADPINDKLNDKGFWDTEVGKDLDFSWNYIFPEKYTSTHNPFESWWNGLKQSYKLSARLFTSWLYLEARKNTFWETFVKGLNFGVKIKNALDGFFTETLPKWIDTGTQFVEGLKKGIVDAITGIRDWLYEHLGKPVIDAVKSIFDIGSPSKVFAWFGEMDVEGLKVGWQKSIPSFLNMVNDDLAFVDSQIADDFGYNDADISTVTTIDRSDDPIYTALSQSINDIKEMLGIIDADMVDSIDKASKTPQKIDTRTFGRAVRNVYA